MKKMIWYLLTFVLLVAAAALILVSPDSVSIFMASVMAFIVILSIWFGIWPIIRFINAFALGRANIKNAVEVKPDASWVELLGHERFFKEKFLDEIYDEYRERANKQIESELIVSNIDNYINEETIALKCWHNVMIQIPGTLTGLGILGTFVGLIIGVSGIRFDTMTNALTSIQTLMAGIGTAFYTSIAGVILSILFNIIFRILWDICVHDMESFNAMFTRYVIPNEEEQSFFKQKIEMKSIVDKIDKLPKNNGFSNSNGADSKAEASYESLLLPQIKDGLSKGEFTFELQPRFDLNTRKIIGSEALVRWHHPKLGVVMPSVFMPTIEKNGFIIKLDHYIWESVCATIRRWIDSGMAVKPITVNISKTDLLAMDVGEYLTEMVNKYRIPPRYLEIDISENAYLQTKQTAIEAETALRQSGFRVAIDGFDGDFMVLNSIADTKADTLKIDLNRMKDKDTASITNVLNQAANMNMTVIAERVENMEMVSALRKGGCTEGQGYYLSRPLTLEEFEKEINKR